MIIKYVTPAVLFIIWFIGIFELFAEANSFEIAIDLIVMVSVLVISYLFTRKQSAN